jgi:hypothetical protein
MSGSCGPAAAAQATVIATERLYTVDPCGYDHASRTVPLDENRTRVSKYPCGLVIVTSPSDLNAPDPRGASSILTRCLAPVWIWA